jgi:hypothetical protein
MLILRNELYECYTTIFFFTQDQFPVQMGKTIPKTCANERQLLSSWLWKSKHSGKHLNRSLCI